MGAGTAIDGTSSEAGGAAPAVLMRAVRWSVAEDAELAEALPVGHRSTGRSGQPAALIQQHAVAYFSSWDATRSSHWKKPGCGSPFLHQTGARSSTWRWTSSPYTKCHRYATVLVDPILRLVLWVGNGRSR